LKQVGTKRYFKNGINFLMLTSALMLGYVGQVGHGVEIAWTLPASSATFASAYASSSSATWLSG
jgi:hypothetical protein